MIDVDPYLSGPGVTGIFTRLARVGLLVDALQRQCLDRYGLHFIDFSVLRLLHLQGPPHRLSPSELAELTLRSTGGMTQVIDRLAERGLVERTADERDRRRVAVRLTPRGRRVAAEAQEDYARQRAELLGGLTDVELEEIDRGIRRLLDVLSTADTHPAAVS